MACRGNDVQSWVCFNVKLEYTHLVLINNAARSFYGFGFIPQVKRMITPKRTTGMVLGYLVYLVMTTLAFSTIAWWRRVISSDRSNYHIVRYDKETNRSYYRMLPDVSKKYLQLEHVQYTGRLIMLNMVNPILYGTILIATILLIVAFKKSIQVRKSLTDKTKAGNSAKEKRLVQSVIAVFVIFIVTSGPKNLVKLMDIVGQFWLNYNSWRRSLGFIYAEYIDELAIFVEAVNHSINIFVYLSMNSKFRGRFKGLVGLTSDRGVST